MDQFLETYNLPKITREEMDNLNRPITIKEIELIINNFPEQKTVSPEVRCSLLNSTKLLRKKLYQSSAISSKRWKQREYLLTHV